MKNLSMLQHRGKEYCLKQLAEELKKVNKLSPTESKIIEARQVGCPFSELSESDKKIVAAELIFIGSCITGCNTPSTDRFMEVLCDEIVIHVAEFGYGHLTETELFLSLRINTKGGNRMPSGLEIEVIEFSGFTFNIDYLSKVLSNYTTIRNQLDRKLQNQIDGY